MQWLMYCRILYSKNFSSEMIVSILSSNSWCKVISILSHLVHTKLFYCKIPSLYMYWSVSILEWAEEVTKKKRRKKFLFVDTTIRKIESIWQTNELKIRQQCIVIQSCKKHFIQNSNLWLIIWSIYFPLHYAFNVKVYYYLKPIFTSEERFLK